MAEAVAAVTLGVAIHPPLTASRRRDATRRGSTPSCCWPRFSACGRERLVLDRDAPLPDDTGASRSCLRGVRRASRSRTSSGARAFGGSRSGVDRRVLIPRPETELLVEVGLGCPPAACGRRRDGQRRGRAGVEGRAAGPGCAGSGRLGRRCRRSRGPTPRGSSSRSSSMLCDLLDDGRTTRCWRTCPYVCRGRGAGAGDRGLRAAGALFAGVDGLDVIRRLVEVATGRSRLLALGARPRAGRRR